MAKKKSSNKLKIIFMLIILTCALFMTIEIVEKFPSLRENYEAHPSSYDSNKSVFESEITCHGITEFIVYIDDTIINEGDIIDVGINYELQRGNGEYFYTLAGFNTDSLEYRLEDGFNSLGLQYYRDNKIKFYTQGCSINPSKEEVSSKTLEELNEKYSGASFYDVQIKRPSFIDSWVGGIILFLSLSVLMGGFFQLIVYFIGRD